MKALKRIMKWEAGKAPCNWQLEGGLVFPKRGAGDNEASKRESGEDWGSESG